ncbi:helix-turn-helix domain-containing protein [Herbiconiux sp. UC225_62]|uniref:helix-turn-helix domain-containing protein n=1 Tax=Herbiconiux sp. UC225_62 TaxID=3350168 RepID=UPI0036D30B68
MKNVRSLGLRALALRVGAGLSQEELAARAYVSRKWLSDFERGKPTVEASKVLDVFQALGYEFEVVPIAELSSTNE